MIVVIYVGEMDIGRYESYVSGVIETLRPAGHTALPVIANLRALDIARFIYDNEPLYGSQLFTKFKSMVDKTTSPLTAQTTPQQVATFMEQYISAKSMPQQVPVEQQRVPPIGNSEFKVVVEENDSNYGHAIFGKGDVAFPKEPAIEWGDATQGNATQGNATYGYDAYTGGVKESPTVKYTIIQDAVEAKKLTPLPAKSFLDLRRYQLNKFDKPRSTSGPTLSLSLFIPNNIRANGITWAWASKYLINMIMQGVVFTHFQPDGNYRNYFDGYMLDTMAGMSGDDPALIFTRGVPGFEYSDFEGVDATLADRLTGFFADMKDYENYPFNNGLERFLFYFKNAAPWGDFYAYKFKGPFVESAGTALEGHITNGFLGQHVRFISTRQTDYSWGGYTIKKPRHLVFRDAHTNTSGKIDMQWIDKMNAVSNERYFLPVSLGYIQSWHDTVSCAEKPEQRSAIAGLIQMVNPSIHENDSLWFSTIGLAFIIGADDQLPLLKERPVGNHYTGHKIDKYEYGIDEYVLSALFAHEHVISKSIYLNNKNFWEFLERGNATYGDDLLDGIAKAVVFLMFYAEGRNLITNATRLTRRTIIQTLETLRSGPVDNSLVGFLLSYVPNKYMMNMTMFSSVHPRDWFDRDLGTVDEMATNFSASRKDYGAITPAALENAGMSCKRLIESLSPAAWCQRAYSKKFPLKKSCPSADYYSGYYTEEPPSLRIGILRSPADIPLIDEHVETNKLYNILNKSNYKLKREKDVLYNAIVAGGNVDDTNTGHIRPAVQNVILKYGDPGVAARSFAVITFTAPTTLGESIAQAAYEIKTGGGTQSEMWCPLIWKALNYHGYDVPPNWYDDMSLDHPKDYLRFNEQIIALANTPGWADYAIRVLLDNKHEYGAEDNAFDSAAVTEHSAKFAENLGAFDGAVYKMRTFGGGVAGMCGIYVLLLVCVVLLLFFALENCDALLTGLTGDDQACHAVTP